MRVNEVRDFSKRGDALPIPNLIDVQTTAYQKFLQKDIEAIKRKGDGLEALLREDAITPARARGHLSDRAARRLFDRLVTLGGVRELSGRPTFRVYGL